MEDNLDLYYEFKEFFETILFRPEEKEVIELYEDSNDIIFCMGALYSLAKGYSNLDEWYTDAITYSLARYSALPMDLNGNFEKWSNVRRKELEIEFKICHDYLEYPYVSSNELTERDFDILLDFF